MGNQLAAHRSNHKQIDELQNACVEAPLGGGRLLQTMLYKHDVGKLVVKVYNKQGESLDLKPYKQQLKNIHDRLKCLARPHVWPFQEFVETENTGFMIRPFIFQNLYDRICARPFLTYIEKLLEALVQCHSLGVCHGDIKSENTLVTSWNWIFLTDFASYKPTYLPAGNPADFSYFFDIAGERRCHVAPERFFVESELKTKPRGDLTPAMDVFSLGCVIAELFRDGKGLFDFSELHRYRKGQFDPATKLNQVDPNVQSLILHMIQLDPSSRWTSSEYLTHFTPTIFPHYFAKALAPFFGSLLFENADAKIALLKSQFRTLEEQLHSTTSTENFVNESVQDAQYISKRPSFATNMHDAVYNPDNVPGTLFVSAHPNRQESLEKIRDLEANLSAAIRSFSEISESSIRQSVASSYRHKSSQTEVGCQTSEQTSTAITEGSVDGGSKNDGMLLLLVLLCSLVRCPKLLESKRTVISLLAEISRSCTPECCLNRMLPYLLAMVSDSAPSIRALALHFILKLLSSIRHATITNYERRLYQDYILPSLSLLPSDPEEIVRVELAAGVSELAACAGDYLQKDKTSATGAGLVTQQKREHDLSTLRERIVRVTHELVSGKSSSATRLALSMSVSKLADFYGNKKIPDLLLLMTTFMNDSNKLKVAFFDCLQTIDAKALSKSLTNMQPFLEEGFKDKDATVLASAVSLARHFCVHVNSKKDFVLGQARSIAPLMNHPSTCVRAQAIQFMAAVAAVLTPADAFARLLPMMKGTLPQDPYVLDSEEIIADALQSDRISGRKSATPRSVASSRSRSTKVGFSNRDEEKYYLFPKTAAYCTRVCSRMIQCGLTRHQASLEEVSRSDSYCNRISSSRAQDVRSRSALMTHELSHSSVRQRNIEGGTSASLPVDVTHSHYRSAMADAVNTGIDARACSQTLDAWKPEGVLLAHYVEHRRSINRIAVSRGSSHPFFATASNDGTVKVWDLKRIDDDLSFRSCATYAAQKGEILSVSSCEDNQSIASASSHGSIHVWRVNYAPQATNGHTSDHFTGISSRREISPEEGAVLQVQQWDALLLYTSQRGVIHAWDIRMKDDAWKIRVDPREGLIRHIAVDPLNGGTWIVTGSSQGVLDLWDVRFKLKVAQWTHPSRNAIVDVAPTRAPSEQMRTMGIKSHGPFVYIAAGGNEVGLWDVQETTCKQVFRSIPREETEVKKMELPSTLGHPSAPHQDNTSPESIAATKYCAYQLRRPPAIHEGIQSILPIGEGSIITGGHDKYIRVWDGVDPKHSFPMCGPTLRNPYSETQESLGGYEFQYNRHFERGVPIIDECCLPTHFQRSTNDATSLNQNTAHVDCITDLATVHVHERILISASRDGIVKIWK